MSFPVSGCLWVVATPIGNRHDFSARAIDTLRQVALVAAEDTRHSRPLLRYYQIATPLIALHEHNEQEAVKTVLCRLQAGASVALICDAGTPLISDPGFRLLRAARTAGMRCAPVPGACAAIAALSVAGLPSDRFVFEGFLPPKSAARRARLRVLMREPRTLIFYESAHRLAESLRDMCDVLGRQRDVVLARELTKLFETVLSNSLEGLAAHIGSNPQQQRGEHVLVVAGCGDEVDAKLTEGKRVFVLLREALPPGKAARLAAAITGAPRRALYDA